MWRQITGVILVVFGIVILGAELFSIIALDYYLVFNPAFIVFRIVIAVVLIWLGVKLKNKTETYDDYDDDDEW